MKNKSSASSHTLQHYDMVTDILLAIMPASVMIGVLLLLNLFGTQDVLFSSLASSAFLIYFDPKHSANSVRTLTIAQLSAAFIGYVVYIIMGAGYESAAVAMVLTIGVMIAARAIHPPAVSTALVFAFQHTKPSTLLMFLLGTGLLVLLVGLQRASVWLINRSERKNKMYERNS